MTDLVPRSNVVLEEINSCHSNMIEKALYLSELLCEVRDNKYFVDYGHGRFDSWLAVSPIDIKPRQAYYLMSINDKSKKLGLTRADLQHIGISKLKAIFSIDNPTLEQVQSLLKDAETKSTDEIVDSVAAIRLPEGQEPHVFITVKLPKSAKEIVDNAVELCKKVVGSEMSFSEALEYICVEYSNEVRETEKAKAESEGVFTPEAVQDLSSSGF